MEILEILINITKKLKIDLYRNRNLEARMILAYIIECNVNEIFLKNHLSLTNTQKNKLNRLIARRNKGEPISYLLGKREFYGYEFIINKHVLDPRPDSETLIELIKEDFVNLSTQSLNIIELGIGSGCLIISILNEYQKFLGVGVDISNKALRLARKNCLKFNLLSRIKLINSDLFAKIKITKKFDIIISNPPYIPTKEIANLQKEVVEFEPRIALDGGLDGLEFYRRIATDSINYLKKNGSVIVEIGHNQESEIIKIFNNCNFYLFSKKHDLSNIARVLHFKPT